MQFTNEDQVREALDIDSWRNLSKEKFMTFVSALPEMDKEVAIAIVNQFPHFQALASNALSSMQKSWDGALSENSKSQKRAQKAFERYVGILERELQREEWSGEDRFRILELIDKASERIAEKDRENKAWILKGLGVVGGVAAFGLMAAVALLGGKAEIPKNPLG